MRLRDEGPTDEEIVEQVLSGNREEFRLLIERHQERIRRLGRRFFRAEHDVEDFIQEVFIRAFEKLPSYRREARFVSWLVKVGWNHGINSVKRVKQHQQLPEEIVADRSMTPEEIGMAADAKEALREAMRKLPEQYASCIDLYFFFGMRYADIGEMTGLPVNTIKSNVFRGKKLLRDMLRHRLERDE